jgi:DNA-binding NarL/FixJ family response regulator
MDGITCVREARSRVRHLRAVAVSTLDDQRWVSAAFEAGAKAYVLKTAGPDDLAVAVRQAFTHSVYVAPRPAAGTPAAAGGLDERHGLTRREIEILRLVAEGYSNAELARMLWVTEQTVKFHLGNIYRKLQVANRTEASRWAQLHGVLDQPAAPAGSQDDPAGSVRPLRAGGAQFA